MKHPDEMTVAEVLDTEELAALADNPGLREARRALRNRGDGQ